MAEETFKLVEKLSEEPTFVHNFEQSDEPQFQSWYNKIAAETGLKPNPDAPEHFYDYRAAWKAGAKPDITGHWPSQFKREGHPNIVVGGIDTRTGEPAEEFTYAGPIKPPEILDYLKEPAAWFKMGMGGLVSGISGYAKTADIPLEISSITEPIISNLDEAAKWWEPKEDAPGRISNWVRSAFQSSGQSISAGLVGALIAYASKGKSIKGMPSTPGADVVATTIGAILSKGLTFGGAQYYDLTKDIEKEFKARGATPEELAIIQKENAAWKTASAVAEVGGEWASDFISARIFGLVGNPAIRAPIKAGIMAAFGRFAKKMGWAQLAEISGEEMTTAVQYKAAEAITIPQSDYWKQFEDTMAITGIQTLMMGAGASAVASTRRRSSEAFLQDFKAKASAALQEKGVNKDTADTIADSIIKRSSKTDAADNAIADPVTQNADAKGELIAIEQAGRVRIKRYT